MPKVDKQEHPNTFFIVRLSLNGKEFILGPYYDISSATQVAVDFVPFYARALSYDLEELNYNMKLQECVFENNEWIPLCTILKETYK